MGRRIVCFRVLWLLHDRSLLCVRKRDSVYTAVPNLPTNAEPSTGEPPDMHQCHSHPLEANLVSLICHRRLLHPGFPHFAHNNPHWSGSRSSRLFSVNGGGPLIYFKEMTMYAHSMPGESSIRGRAHGPDTELGCWWCCFLHGDVRSRRQAVLLSTRPKRRMEKYLAQIGHRRSRNGND